MSFTFKVEKRDGKVTEDTMAMGVVSGAKMDSVPVQFDRKEFFKLFSEAGQNSIISIEGLDEAVEVTVKHIDQAPFTNEIHHVEFYALERGVEMNADIPLTLVGEAPAANLDAIINQPVHSVAISCRPKDLIQELEVDMTLLKEIGDTVTVSDLKVPSGITINHEPETVLLSVAAAKEDEPEEIPDADEVPVAGKEDEAEVPAGEESQADDTNEGA